MKSILIVEDDKDIREHLAKILELEGYRILSTANGVEALAALEKNRATPFLILLDLMMPVLDGAGFLSEFQKRDPARLQDTPIVVFSAGTSLMHSHVKTFLRKPVNLNLLLETVEKYVGRS